LVNCVCVCFWVFHKHRWECKVLMELNILILISTENPQYFKYISDKNTSDHILKSSNGQTKEFVLKTFQSDYFRKSFVLVLFQEDSGVFPILLNVPTRWSEFSLFIFLSTDSTRTAFILFLTLSLVNLFFSPRVFWLHKPW